MILVDTNVLVALVCARDALHQRAREDLQRMVKQQFIAPTPILSEACFLLTAKQRAKLAVLVEQLPMLPPAPASTEEEARIRRDTFAWLQKYPDADFCDGYLAVLASRDKALRVWSYDREFTLNIWRRINGTPIPMA